LVTQELAILAFDRGGSSALAADLIKRRLSVRVPEAGGAAGGGLMG
jgi:hypothetical protein